MKKTVTNDRSVGKRAAMPTAAVFDLDNTITRHGTYTPFILSVARRQPIKFFRIGSVLLATMLYKLRLLARGRLKEIMLTAVLAGAPRAEVMAHAARFIDRCVCHGLRPGALRAIAAHKVAGDLLVLATASFDFYAERLGRQLGFDSIIATRAAWDDEGRVSGKIEGENCRGPAKLRQLESVLPDLRDHYRVVAYSDHHVDMPLLRWADQGIAVNPSKRLRACAVDEGFSVVDWNTQS